PHLVASDAEHVGDVVTEPEYALAADVERPMLPLPVVLRDCRAWLHRIDDDAVAAQVEACDVGGGGKGRGDLFAVAVMEVEADIVGHVVVKHRGIRRSR